MRVLRLAQVKRGRIGRWRLQRAARGRVQQPGAQRLEAGQVLPREQLLNAQRLAQRAVGELAAQAVGHLRDALFALHAQHAVFQLDVDLVKALFARGCAGGGRRGGLAQHHLGGIVRAKTFGGLDGLDLGQPLIGLLELGEVDFFFQQGLVLRALPGVAANGTAHPLGREAVGVVFTFNQDEAAVAVVTRIGLEHGMGRGAAASKAVQHDAIGRACHQNELLNQASWLWCIKNLCAKYLLDFFCGFVRVAKLGITKQGTYGAFGFAFEVLLDQDLPAPSVFLLE